MIINNVRLYLASIFWSNVLQSLFLPAPISKYDLHKNAEGYFLIFSEIHNNKPG